MPQGDSENKNMRKAKTDLIETLWKSIGAPEIKETPNTVIEAAFTVFSPGGKNALCYCVNKRDAELVATSIQNATRMAMASVIL